jgi:hypothetical protein
MSILPDIGVNIRSLVVSNEWTGVLSKIFLSQFGERMSMVFPRLKHLILVAFITKSLTLFLDCLQNLTELSEITIHGLFSSSDNSNELSTLLYRILSANNNRLNSIIFDYYSGDFCLDANPDNIVFSSIVKLHISLKNVDDLHQLLTILPRLCYLHTQINFVPAEFDEHHQYNIVSTLKYFYLQSFRFKWSLNVLKSILKRIPNVEELSIEIDGDDDGDLVDGHQMFSLLFGLPLKKFNYFIRLYFLPSMNRTEILSSWQEFKQDFACIINEAEDILILYTLPFVFHDLVLRCSLATNKIFSENYASQARFLHLYRVSTHISETFSVLQKCHRLRRLCLQIDEKNTSITGRYFILCVR